MKKIVVILFLILLTRISFSQYEQNIRGVVKDKESQRPIQEATLTLLTVSPVVIRSSNSEGEFLFHTSVGRHSIKVVKEGYKEMVINDLILNSAKEIVLTIEMVDEVKTLGEVKIKSSKGSPDKTNNDMIGISGRLFTIDQTNRFAGSLGDPSRMASSFAGVSGVGGQRNDIIIRGNSPMGLLWRLEGVDIPNPNHFSSQGSTGGPVSILNNNTLANSDFITGAFPSEYGNALGGVFDLKMRNGNNQKREYTGQIGFNGFEFGIEGPINKSKKSSYMFNYRYSTLGVFDKLGINLTFGGVPNYQDLTLKLNFPQTKTGHWQIAGIGGKSYIAILDNQKDSADLSFGNSYRNDVYNGSDMGVFIISNQLKVNSKSYLKTIAAITYQKLFTHVDSLDSNNTTFLKYANRTQNSKITIHSFYHTKINSRSSVRIGAMINQLSNNFQDSFLNSNQKMQTLREFSGSNYLLQSYIESKYSIKSNLILNSGIYAQYWMMNKSSSVEPRISLKYLFKPSTSFSVGYGLHSQLQPMEVYYNKSYNIINQTYEQTNLNLDMSKAQHIILGFDQLFKRNYRFKAEAYYQQLYNIPVEINSSTFSILNFGADFIGIPNDDSLINKGKGTNKGIEITLEKFFGNGWYSLFSGSFYDSKYVPSNGKTYSTAFDGKYVINLLAGYELKMGKKKNNVFSINGKLTSAGGRRYMPVDITKSVLAGATIYDESNGFSQKFKDYFRLDIRIGYKLNGKKITQEWALDIQNVSNNMNPLIQTFDLKKQASKIEYQQGFFPMMLYRIQF